jgi:hypothetical protein
MGVAGFTTGDFLLKILGCFVTIVALGSIYKMGAFEK